MDSDRRVFERSMRVSPLGERHVLWHNLCSPDECNAPSIAKRTSSEELPRRGGSRIGRMKLACARPSTHGSDREFDSSRSPPDEVACPAVPWRIRRMGDWSPVRLIPTE